MQSMTAVKDFSELLMAPSKALAFLEALPKQPQEELEVNCLKSDLARRLSSNNLIYS